MGHPKSVPGQSNNRLTLCGLSKLLDRISYSHKSLFLYNTNFKSCYKELLYLFVLREGSEAERNKQTSRFNVLLMLREGDVNAAMLWRFLDKE